MKYPLFATLCMTLLQPLAPNAAEIINLEFDLDDITITASPNGYVAWEFNPISIPSVYIPSGITQEGYIAQDIQVNIEFTNGDLLLRNSSATGSSLVGHLLSEDSNLNLCDGLCSNSSRTTTFVDYGSSANITAGGSEIENFITFGISGTNFWGDSTYRLSNLRLDNYSFLTESSTYNEFRLFGYALDAVIVDDILLPDSTDQTLIPVGAGCTGRMCFYDPDYATGYSYTRSIVDAPNFQSVMIPDPLPNGDSIFELSFNDLTFQLEAGEEFFFTDYFLSGVADFEINGIDLTEMLDPIDPTAFVTGISFISDFSDPFSVSMIPKITSTDTIVTVSEPSTISLFLSVLFFCWLKLYSHKPVLNRIRY